MGDESRHPSPIDDLVGACERIISFTAECTEGDFHRSDLIWSAVAFQIIVLGEAAKRLNPEIRERYPEIPWKDMIGMRDILSHKYDRIDLDEIWATVQHDVPELLAGLRYIQAALRG